MLGLVSGLDRKNCWTIAEHRGDASPDGLQHLLARAKWDADAVATICATMSSTPWRPRRDLGGRRDRRCEEGRAHRRGAAPVHRYRRTGRERPSRGVSDLCRPARTRPDRPGPVPAQVLGRGPRPPRRRRNPPDKPSFATKPTLATTLIDRAVAAQSPLRGSAGDEVYGADPSCAPPSAPRPGLCAGVAANRRVPTPRRPAPRRCAARPLPARAWQKHSAGAGATGTASTPGPGSAATEDDTDTGHHHLLIRRNDTTGELAYLRCYSTATGHPATLCGRGRAALADRGILPSRQRPDRPGPTPGPALDLLAPLDHPGHARARLPGRGHRRRTRRPAHNNG